jgi:hypothetical protein
VSSTEFSPYYAVIFTSKLSNFEGYAEMAVEMERLAKQKEGFIGITVSYCRGIKSIKVWNENLGH